MNSNPQKEQMASQAMVRILAAQIEAIWPQEEPLLQRYGISGSAHILDVGCGTGEMTSRLAIKYPQAHVVGVDILDSSIGIANTRYATLAPRLSFKQGDAFALDIESASMDLAVCRHVTQSVPHVDRIVAELKRVVKPGGWIHVLSEDYAMLHMPVRPLDSDELWFDGPIYFGERTGTDSRIGRRTWTLFLNAGLEDLRVDYLIVDTLRVPRDTFARIIESWRDGFLEVLAETGKRSAAQFDALFKQVIDDIRDPEKYCVWHVPVISGRKRI